MLVRSVLFAIAVSTNGILGVQSLEAQTVAQPGEETKLVRVTYSVADLVIPISDNSAFEEPKSAKIAKKAPAELAEALLKVITKTIANKSWESEGGNGSIQYLPTGYTIVVNQTNAVHKEIAELLRARRKLQDVQVSVEVRFVEVAPKTAERVQSMLKKRGQPLHDQAVTLDDKQLLALLEIAQEDRASTIRQTAKITLFNGQKAGVAARFDKVGVRFDLSGVLRPDRKNVRLWLDIENAMTATRVIRTSETFNLPADRVLVWHAGEVGGTHIFVTARPRILVQEEEQIFLGQLPALPGR